MEGQRASFLPFPPFPSSLHRTHIFELYKSLLSAFFIVFFLLFFLPSSFSPLTYLSFLFLASHSQPFLSFPVPSPLFLSIPFPVSSPLLLFPYSSASFPSSSLLPFPPFSFPFIELNFLSFPFLFFSLTLSFPFFPPLSSFSSLQFPPFSFPSFLPLKFLFPSCVLPWLSFLLFFPIPVYIHPFPFFFLSFRFFSLFCSPFPFFLFLLFSVPSFF